MGMTIDDLKKECRYCYREIDNSGHEGFRCTNKNVIKAKGTSWCLPKCADQPCSTCTYREIKDDNECLFYETCSSRTAVCKVQQPDNGCPVYRYFEEVLRIRPKGRWLNKQHLFDYCSAECSSCHKRSNGYVHDNGFSLEHKYYDFCPNCGSDNREVEDGNDD